MKIIFYTNADVANVDGMLTSNIASARYRIILPGIEISKMGVLLSIGKTGSIRSNLTQLINDKINCIIISKGYFEVDIDTINVLRSAGIRIIVDVCDNYFNHLLHGDRYKYKFGELLRHADQIVSSTNMMSNIIFQETGIKSKIISDPFELSIKLPKFNPINKLIKILWFGNNVNIAPLVKIIPQLKNLTSLTRVELNLITDFSSLDVKILDLIDKSSNENFTINKIKWSNSALSHSMALNDLVVIPGLKDDYFKVKSPNRLVESLISGKLVISNGYDSYSYFDGGYVESEDYFYSIADAISNPDKYINYITLGQNLAINQHSTNKIAQEWYSLLLNKH